MNFALSEQQEMLQKFARDFMLNKCTKEYVRKMEEDATGYSPEVWQEMAKLGWMGLTSPEEYGGGAMGFFDLIVLLEEMGRACMPGPFFSTVVLGSMAILNTGNEKQKQEFLPRIAQGKLVISLALTEPEATYTPAGISVRAEANGDDYVINGTKLFVSDAEVADYLICVTRTRNRNSNDGITLHMVDTKSPGIKCTPLQTIALDKQAEVVFDNVRVPKKNMLGELDKGWVEVEKILDRGALGKCAEMVGGAQKVLEMTIEYAKEREQFGRPIGSFQAVQHHCADMVIDLEGSKYITYQAASLLTEGVSCHSEIAMAKAWVSEAYRRIVTLGHQVHGAISFTKDHDIQLYFRRAKVAELVFGDADYHYETVAREIGL